jgi:hypothetical protein
MRGTAALATTVLCLLATSAARAVSPLVVDDAEPMDKGGLQLDAGWQWSRAGSSGLHSAYAIATFGLTSHGDVGALFGYQWFKPGGGLPHVEGVMDLTFYSKWRLWQSPDEKFKISGRVDLKAPTASEQKGLGTGSWDAGAVVIATRCWDRLCLDWNAGYLVSDATRMLFGDDQGFAGQAVQYQVNERITVIGEAYTLLPIGNPDGDAQLYYSGGLLFTVREEFNISVLAGSAAGRDSPDFTSFVGFTASF